jgi:hypothetical protein
VNSIMKILMAMSLLLVVSCSNEDIPADAPVNGRTDVANPPKVNVRVEPPAPVVNPVVPVVAGPVLPPPVVPVPPVIPILGGDERHGGNSDDDNSCNDQDSDGVCDDKDKCANFDDAIDPDGDGSPGQLVGDLVEGCDCEPENALVGIGDLCSSTTECAISTCDAQGSGECIVENAAFGVDCGNPGEGECDADDQCDGQGNCIAEVTPNGTACGNPILAVCDAADTCVNGECIDNRASAETVCRPVPEGALCDVEDLCDGVNITCPDNVLVANGTVCRLPASECDQAEVCNGASASCPPDEFLVDGSNCGEQPQGVCDFQDQCEAGICVNKFASSDYICRTAADEQCDIAENCSGVAGDIDCPPDVVVEQGTTCGGPGSDQEFCSVDPVCTGTGRCFGGPLPDGFPTGQPCNANTGEERCDGTIFCENGEDVCANFDGSEIECTEQIVEDPNDPSVVTAAFGDPTLFGYSVAMFGEWAAVGNGGPSDGDPNTVGSLVYIYKFDIDLDQWVEHETLNGVSVFTAGNGFSLDMYEDLLIVGQYNANTTTLGGFKIWRLENDTWNNLELLRNDTGSERFGNAVSIYSDGGSKQYAVAGSEDNDTVIFYIYNYLGTGDWDLVLTTVGATGIRLGEGVRVRGDLAIAGAPTFGANLNGRVKVWHRSGSGPFAFSYDVDGIANNEHLGGFGNDAVEIDPQTGVFFAGNSLAQVKVFQDNATSATLLQTIANGTLPTPDNRGFGQALALNGNTLLVGDSNANSGEGLLYIYTTADDQTWSFSETVSPSVAATNQRFGWNVASNQNRAIIGAPAGDSMPTGGSKAYFYSLIP